MWHPCNAKQSSKSQNFLWLFSHALVTSALLRLSVLLKLECYLPMACFIHCNLKCGKDMYLCYLLEFCVHDVERFAQMLPTYDLLHSLQSQSWMWKGRICFTGCVWDKLRWYMVYFADIHPLILSISSLLSFIPFLLVSLSLLISITSSFAHVINISSCVYPTFLLSICLTLTTGATLSIKLLMNASCVIVSEPGSVNFYIIVTWVNFPSNKLMLLNIMLIFHFLPCSGIAIKETWASTMSPSWKICSPKYYTLFSSVWTYLEPTAFAR